MHHDSGSMVKYSLTFTEIIFWLNISYWNIWEHTPWLFIIVPLLLQCPEEGNMLKHMGLSRIFCNKLFFCSCLDVPQNIFVFWSLLSLVAVFSRMTKKKNQKIQYMVCVFSNSLWFFLIVCDRNFLDSKLNFSEL